MLNKPKECNSCILGDNKGGFSNPEGTCSNGVLIIGEALGENEKIDGLPFRPYAESGSALQTCINNLSKFGIKEQRENFAYWNLIACQPPRNLLEKMPYEEAAITECRKNYFNTVINYYKPKVIFALGNLPLKWLVPEVQTLQYNLKQRIKEAKESKDKEQIKYLQSQVSKLTIGAMRGYLFKSIYGIPLVPSFHPSFVTRTGRVLIGVLLRDLMFALDVAKNGIEDYKFENYHQEPKEEEIEKFIFYCKNNKNLPISYDIETPFTTLMIDESEIEFGTEVRDINSIQFSIPVLNSINNGKIKTKSIFLDWDEKNLGAIRFLLNLPNDKVGWNNWRFDETNLKFHLGNSALKGTRFDGMWMFKHLNSDFRTVGRALQFAANFYVPNLPAWKHLSEDEPRKYGLIDVDATLKAFLGMKKEMQSAKLDVPNSKNLYDGYVDDVVKLHPILSAMTHRGFPINLEDRDKFKKELQLKRIEVMEELQDLYPTELRRPDPKLGYKVIPKEVNELTIKFEELFCDFNSLNFIIFLDKDIKSLALSKFIEANSRREDEKKEGQTGLVVKTFLIDGIITKRYCRLDKFKPNSPDQVSAYIQYKGYKTKKKRKGKVETESTDKNAMYDLFEETNDNFFLRVGFYRELSKIVQTYINGWKTDNEGRVHSVFSAIPATGQLSCSPNIQNCFSGDTELLTMEGWKRFDILSGNEIVAQYNSNNEEIDFVAPLDFIMGINNQLLHIKTNDQIDLLVTSEHDCLLQLRNGRFTKIKANNYKEDCKQYSAGDYIGGDLEFSFEQLIVIAALQADGWITPDKAVDWKLKKVRKINRLKMALDKLRLEYRVSDNVGGYKRFYLSSKSNNLSWLLDKKFFSAWILKLNKSCFKFLANEVYFWDGCWSRKSMYSSSDKINCDWVQILTCLTNRRAKIREYHNGNINSNTNYQVDASNRNYSMTTNRVIQEIDNSTKNVYCVTMPRGTVIVRRRGLVSITGNSPGHGTRYNSKDYIIMATRFRNTIQPKTNHTFIGVDYKGFHAIMLGVEAEDDTYIRLAKLGIHDYLTANMIRNEYTTTRRVVELSQFLGKQIEKSEADKLRDETLEWIKDLDSWLDLPDEDLIIKLDWIKKKHKLLRDAQAKPAVHGVGFGMGVRKFFTLNKHAFKSLEEPNRILNLLKGIFPKVFIWQDYIKNLAHEQTYLISRYGSIRRFWDVYDFRLLKEFRSPKSEYEKVFKTSNGKYWLRTDGQQVKEAIAFLPANNAFGKKKEAMRDLEELDLNNKYRLILDNHDELLFECPDELIDEAAPIITKIMENPTRAISTTLYPNGISCPTSIKIGKKWGEMREYKI